MSTCLELSEYYWSFSIHDSTPIVPPLGSEFCVEGVSPNLVDIRIRSCEENLVVCRMPLILELLSYVSIETP
jgi:hypothetical protein